MSRSIKSSWSLPRTMGVLVIVGQAMAGYARAADKTAPPAAEEPVALSAPKTTESRRSDDLQEGGSAARGQEPGAADLQEGGSAARGHPEGIDGIAQGTSQPPGAADPFKILRDQIRAFETAPQVSDYKFLKGDLVEVRVLGYGELSKTYTVSEDGTLVVGLGDPVMATGKTAGQVKEVLERELGRFLQKPKVSVFLAKPGERRVFVIGDLPRAGQVALVGQGTLLETLTQAGWKYDPFGGHQARLVRQDRTLTVDVAAIMRAGSTDLNIRLKPDDIVILNSPDPVVVIGEVRKPDRYPLGERASITVREVIARSQGITEKADLTSAKIIHKTGTEERLDLNRYLFPQPGDASSDVVLQGGDTLYVPQGGEIGVFVLGMVGRPGYYRQATGLTVLQALALGDEPQFGAKLSHARLVKGYSSGNPRVVRVNLDHLVYKGDMSQNLAMENGDVLYIPETTTSDVLDFLGRLLSPLNLGFTAGVAAATAIGAK
ncbi:MAG: polysaccharide biosynthesis/export family protein [Nitrospirae bacterium]|nr:polysaccharide biosynthesis/export family protein [Nitrospirota bacterium]